MHKLWYAGVLAVCGLLFLGGVPAHADPRGWALRGQGRSLGLGPDGRAPIDVTRPTARQLKRYGGGLPLLGGLGGRPPVNARPRTPDQAGMPPGDPVPPTRAFTPEGRPIAGVDPQYK